MSTPLTPKEQAQFISFTLEQFRKDLVEQLKKQAADRAEFVPDGVAESVAAQLLKRDNEAVQEVALLLLDAGRLVDMRRLSFRNRPVSRDRNFILEWIQRHRNRVKITRVPGYKSPERARARLSQQQIDERVAGAIIASRGGKEYTSRNRRKSWRYAKTVYGRIGRLQSDLARTQADYFAKALAEATAKALNQGPIQP